ncbi:DUF4283 domain protein, partial [Trifolium medium]|nr:DUF4283 domain protein [Trifolium medium]
IQAKEGEAEAEGVKVGEVLVRLEAQKAAVGNAGVTDKEFNENINRDAQFTEKEVGPSASVYIRKYKPTTEDVKWAQNGVVVTVINGEVIPVVQDRIADAGFKDLAIIPM